MRTCGTPRARAGTHAVAGTKRWEDIKPPRRTCTGKDDPLNADGEYVRDHIMPPRTGAADRDKFLAETLSPRRRPHDQA